MKNGLYRLQKTISGYEAGQFFVVNEDDLLFAEQSMDEIGDGTMSRREFVCGGEILKNKHLLKRIA